MKSCEAKRIDINLISFQKYGSVNQEAGPGNKDGWEKEEGRGTGLHVDSCVLGSSGTSTVSIRVSPSGVESAVLGCQLAPHQDRQASSEP